MIIIIIMIIVINNYLRSVLQLYYKKEISVILNLIISFF